jgi:hypothetical protein
VIGQGLAFLSKERKEKAAKEVGRGKLRNLNANTKIGYYHIK